MSPPPDAAPPAGELSQLYAALLDRYAADLDGADNEPALRVVHARYLGKEGEIRKKLVEALKTAPGPEKRAVGQADAQIDAQQATLANSDQAALSREAQYRAQDAAEIGRAHV